jgi:hypothetical protein
MFLLPGVAGFRESKVVPAIGTKDSMNISHGMLFSITPLPNFFLYLSKISFSAVLWIRIRKDPELFPDPDP